jgi:hypothetical protein
MSHANFNRVPDAVQRAISAFTRVFDALWLLRRAGTQAVRATGPRIGSAPLTRCAASGERAPNEFLTQGANDA